MVKTIKGPTLPARKQWEKVYQGIRKMRDKNSVPVDIEASTNKCQAIIDDKTQRFYTLIGLMLSSQTKDTMTHKVMKRLKKNGLTVDRMRKSDPTSLAKEIYGVGFHNNKAKFIIKTSQILYQKYDSDIPDNYKELIKLPGIGPKMAFLALSICFGKLEGIAVDTHVHRISNRLGWVNSKTPEQTRKQLQEFLPQELWEDVNFMLADFGKTTCLPLNPKCGKCKVNKICPVGSKKVLKQQQEQFFQGYKGN